MRRFHLLLRPLDLEYVIRDEVLMITTPEEAENLDVTRVYPVNDLVNPDGVAFAGSGQADFDPLIDVIESCVSPETWEGSGPGPINPFSYDNSNVLIFHQLEDVHDETAAFLAALREVGRLSGSKQENDPILLYDGQYRENSPAEAIRKALSQKVDVNLDKVPLSKLADSVSKTYHVPCVLDTKALGDAGVKAETDVTVRVSGVMLRSALDLALESIGLTCVIRDEVLLITSNEMASMTLTLGIYPVGDLVTFRNANEQLEEDFDSLIDAITANVGLSAWSSVGGPGTVECGTFGKAKVLVINQTLPIHERVARLLGELRTWRPRRRAIASRRFAAAEFPAPARDRRRRQRVLLTRSGGPCHVNFAHMKPAGASGTG